MTTRPRVSFGSRFRGAAAWLLVVLLSFMWIRSYFAFDAVECLSIQRESKVIKRVVQTWCERGGMWLRWCSFADSGAAPERGFLRLRVFEGPLDPMSSELGLSSFPAGYTDPAAYSDLMPPALRPLGFHWWRGLAPYPETIVRVPLAAVVAVAAVPVGVMRFRAHRRRRRAVRGLCRICGYDLRGSTSRCPECGTVRSPAPTEAAITGR